MKALEKFMKENPNYVLGFTGVSTTGKSLALAAAYKPLNDIQKAFDNDKKQPPLK